MDGPRFRRVGTLVEPGVTGRVFWWSRGGVLRGRGPARIAFLRKVLEEGPPGGLEPVDRWQDLRTAGKRGEYYLIYFGKERPAAWPFELPGGGWTGTRQFRVEVIDTWNRTVTPVEGLFQVMPRDRHTVTAGGNPKVALPGRPYLALRIRRAR